MRFQSVFDKLGDSQIANHLAQLRIVNNVAAYIAAPTLKKGLPNMKQVIVSINDPTPGDLVIIEYSEIRNGKPMGCTSVKRTVLDGQTPRDLALAMCLEINTEWIKEAFEAKVRDGDKRLIIGCTDLVAHKVAFKASVAGGGGTTVEIDEF